RQESATGSIALAISAAYVCRKADHPQARQRGFPAPCASVPRSSVLAHLPFPPSPERFAFVPPITSLHVPLPAERFPSCARLPNDEVYLAFAFALPTTPFQLLL